MSDVQEAANYVLEHLRTDGPVDIMRQAFAPQDMAEAYAMQDELVKLLSARKGAIGGYKIGLTNPAVQQRIGVDEPCAGVIFAEDIVRSPATLTSANYVRPAAECEVAFTLGSDLPVSLAPFNRDNVSAAVESIAASFEIVDGRPSDAEDRRTLAMKLVATNVAQAGAVLGSQITDWRGIDLVSMRGVEFLNGAAVGEGLGSDVMGHPIEPLVWLANLLAERGQHLLAGQVIVTGSLMTPVDFAAGDTVSFEAEALGEVQLTVE
ncbi:MAG: hydratase [SAR202 cluster bacterium]|nr:fumarylacetoacetate hydrolase family protein [SAR202 cluster bacterium]MDP6662450.1 fumarylacetoacetate hydrolase family protein [SAR202 cluster bacterium]MQG58287.1 hydratase [SAR202 cluster bacterium]